MRRCIWFVWISLLVAVSTALPGAAQDAPIFATNTPRPPQPVITTPSAPINRFVLRPWREADLVEVLYTRVRQLTPSATELQKAVRLTQYELERRFPGAPHDLSARERLLQAMLSAPVGTVDIRPVLRPFIEALVNQQSGGLASFSHGDLQIDVLPANLNGTEPRDAVLHVYKSDADGNLLYNEYVPLVAQADQSWRVLASPDLPAAPLGKVRSLELMGVGDFNSDGLDELAVSLDDGELNRELRIFGWRGGSLVNLAQPGMTIRYGQIDTWMTDGNALEVRVFREESAEWECLGEQGITWRWTANFYRPTPDADGFYFQNTANCLLYGAEPLFAMPIDEARMTINDILPFVPSENDYAAQRARMIDAMLQALDGDTGGALAAALELESSAEPSSWLEEQATAFVAALTTPGTTMVQVCAALSEASQYGACNVDDVLSRIFEERPILRSRDIDEQLAELGITVQSQTTLSTVGRADRQAVRFTLAGEHWWAFAPLDPEFYTAERIDPLVSNAPILPPLPVISAQENLYNALLVDNNPGAALTLIQDMMLSNPQAALSSEMRYLQALCLDLLNDRTRAREAHYNLWLQNPQSVWGQLAAEHLEQR